MTDSTDHASSPGERGGLRSLVTYGADDTVFSAVDGTPWGERVPDRTGLVWVTTEGTPDEVVAQLRGADLAGMPRSVDVISMGDPGRSAATTEAGPSTTSVPFQPSDLTVHALPDGSELSELAKSIMQSIERLSRSDSDVVIVFDDLGRVVTDTSLDDVYQFLHILTGKAGLEGWTMRVGIDVDRVEEEAVRAMEPLFDDVH
jgi:hypothetical protein